MAIKAIHNLVFRMDVINIFIFDLDLSHPRSVHDDFERVYY